MLKNKTTDLKNNNFYSIKTENTILNLKPKSNKFNKTYINIINYIKHKANYFFKSNKSKQITDKNKVNKISDKIIKPLTIKISNENNILPINLKPLSNINKIKFYLRLFKNFNRALVSYIKYNSLNSLIISGKNIINSEMKIKKENKFELIKPTKEKTFLKINNIIINKNKLEENNNIKNNFKKIINVKENQIKTIAAIKNNILILDLIKKENNNLLDLENKNIDNINKTNKRKSSILLFINKLKEKENKDTKVILQNNIRKYINSKVTFKSKIAKILSTNNSYNFNKYNQINNLIRNSVYEFLQKSFISMFSIISKPIFVTTPDIITIQLFFLLFKKEKIKKNYKKSILILENNNKLKTISNILTRFFKKPVKLELIRLYYPYYNSNILVNFFGFFINKIRLRRIVNKFIRKAVKTKSLNNFNNPKKLLPSDIAGIKIKVAGRLLTQRVIPRKTIKIINRGVFSRNKTMFVETARYTNKNKRGAFSITISIGHKLI
jgi:Mitochondrial ribosomal protein (VAR1)